MSANEVLLPPWVIPQGESSTLVDDSTSVFRAAYAPGNAQRVSYVEPRLQVKQTFQGLRGADRAAILAALSRAKGKFATVRAIVGYALRGSFPVTELFINSDFSNGTTGWSNDAQYSIAAIDHGIRATRVQVSAAAAPIFQSVSRTVGVPYCLRGFVNAGKGSPSIGMLDFGENLSLNLMPQGMLETVYTIGLTLGAVNVGFRDPSSSGTLAGNSFDAKWASFSRCALVDNGVNLLLNSDTFTSGSGWTYTAGSATANNAIGPDGTIDTATFFETTANSTHSTQQSVTVPAAAADYSFSVFVSPSNRGFCWVQMAETAGGTATSFFVNLTTGAITNLVTGANWTAISQAVVNYGGGWWRICFTARKTNAATTLQVTVGPATLAGTSSYIGVASPTVAICIWRASLAQSSVPVAAVATTSASVTGTSQTGSSLNIKGLPASSAGLLLEGDPFEVNGELKLTQSALNSDAAGLGFLTFGPSLCRSPSDGDAVVIAKPMGKFILAADSSWVNDFGVYANIDITLEAINE